MKGSGPIVSNVLLDAVLTEDVSPVKTAEPGFKRTILPTYRVIGKAFCDGAPAAGAKLLFEPRKQGAQAEGRVEFGRPRSGCRRTCRSTERRPANST